MNSKLAKLALTAALGLAITLLACEDKEKKQTPAETQTAEPTATAETQEASQEAAADEEECADVCGPAWTAEDEAAAEAMKAALAKATAATKAAKAEEVVKGTFTDTRDSRNYKTVKIGEQVWMAENLNYEAKDSKCYDNKPDNCKKYGRLYDWETAKKSCPSEWHLPSNAEWEVLMVAVGGNETAGKYLKSTSDWNESSNGEDRGTNDYGFSALPGGYGNSIGIFVDVGGYSPSDGYFYGGGVHGGWWSGSEFNANYAYYRFMDYSCKCSGYFFSGGDKSYLFSVRCIKD